MRQLQFMQSNTFRWASAVTGVFAVFVIVLFGFIYLKIDDYLVARTDRMIATQIDYIAALPPERRLDAITDHLRQDSRGVQFAGLFGVGGHRIAGNMAKLPSGLEVDVPAQSAKVVRLDQADRGEQKTRAIARRMQNGDVLVIGRKVDEAAEISHVVGQALALGLLPAFCLCLLAGAWQTSRGGQPAGPAHHRRRPPGAASSPQPRRPGPAAR
jgi:hypothetical protein